MATNLTDELDLRWGVAQRFEFIEWRAWWVGRINRKDLEDQFHISTPQASADFKRYQDAVPRNIEYDATAKTYVATPLFEPKFLVLSAERFLRQLQAVKVGAIRLEDTWFEKIPAADVIPTITRAPQAYVLRPILQAIETRSSITIDYLSFTKQEPRTVCPHALAHDGYRWHVRALSIDRQEYRDYVLARIISVSQRPEACNVDPSDDIAWQRNIKLRLIAHPGLNQEQKAAIEHDFRMRDGKLEVETRTALAFYFIRRHNLDLADHPDLPPQRAQLFLENLEEVNAAVEAANIESKALVKRRLMVASTT